MHKIGDYLMFCPNLREPAFTRGPGEVPLGFPTYASTGNVVRCIGLALYGDGAEPFQYYRPDQFDQTMLRHVGIGAGGTMLFAAAVLVGSTILFDYSRITEEQLMGTQPASPEQTPTPDEQALIRDLVLNHPKWRKAAMDWFAANGGQWLLPRSDAQLDAPDYMAPRA